MRLDGHTTGTVRYRVSTSNGPNEVLKQIRSTISQLFDIASLRRERVHGHLNVACEYQLARRALA
jgi:hypothetical protein